MNPILGGQVPIMMLHGLWKGILGSYGVNRAEEGWHVQNICTQGHVAP